MDAAAALQQGLQFHQAGRLAEARQLYTQVLAADPNNFDGLHLLALIDFQEGRHHVALKRLERALALGQSAQAFSNHGLILLALERPLEALASFDRAVTLDSNAAANHFHRARILGTLSRYAEAVDALDRVIALAPNVAEAHWTRGVALQALGRHAEAVTSFDRAIALNPDHSDTHLSRGSSLLELQRYAEVIDASNRAIRLKAACAVGYLNHALALDALGRTEEAVASFDTARAYDPTLELVDGLELSAALRICQWDLLPELVPSVLARIDAGEVATPPGQILAIPSTPAQQKRAAELFCAQRINAPDGAPFPRPRTPGKIRLGYFSPDFGTHPVSYLTAGLFEAHDRTKFDVFGFSFMRGKPDEMRRRLSQAFDRLIDVQDKTDAEVVALARSLNLDIAVDLAGHTADCRTGIFARGAAPVQVSYLGYPGTMGLAAIDYMIADEVLVPAAQRIHYTEKIAYLPSYQVNDWKRPLPTHTFARSELGLPEDGFVFCGFNNTYKFSPDLFDVWMRLLQRVDRSVLWLREVPGAAMTNLKAEAERRGISAQRLVFAPPVPMMDHLARHRCADLFLDTFHYGAHTTASDALWMGLPVVTMLGGTFASCVAASLLAALDVPELIAPNRDAYEALAFDLATHAEKLKAVKQRLEANRSTSALFDTARFTRNIEAAYSRMMEIYERGSAPEHFSV